MAMKKCDYCGQGYDEKFEGTLDNGCPACPQCVAAEEAKEAEEARKYKEKSNN